jgi:hypothetical protein
LLAILCFGFLIGCKAFGKSENERERESVSLWGGPSRTLFGPFDLFFWFLSSQLQRPRSQYVPDTYTPNFRIFYVKNLGHGRHGPSM